MKRHVANREIYSVQIEKKMNCHDEPLEEDWQEMRRKEITTR
jgi:hypothetical protein